MREQQQPLPTDAAAPGGAATAEVAAREALRAHAVTAPLADAPLQPVPGGLSNWAWRVLRHEGEDYFVRLARVATERLGADHLNECRLFEAIASLGLAPQVIRCDPAARLLVTRWIDDVSLGTPVRDAVRLDKVAAALAALHSHVPVPALRRVNFETQARGLEAGLHAPDRTNPFLETAGIVFERLAPGAPAPVLCHNDMHPLNMLFDRGGRLWLVDWEYAGVGDPVFDLASFASQHGLDAPRRTRLAERYAAAGGSVEPGRLELACWAFDYVQWLWYRAAWSQADAGDPAQKVKTIRSRAIRLAASLRRRASGVLRCNNRGLPDS